MEAELIRRVELQAGLIKEVTREGAGENLSVNDHVTVHCTGKLDGPEKRIFWRYSYCYYYMKLYNIQFNIAILSVYVWKS